MTIECTTVEEYIAAIPADRRDAFQRLRDVIWSRLPEGFEETIQYSMPSYVVPLSRYPEGYLGSSGTPLPFISLASQKNYISLYHGGIYSEPELSEWFVSEYAERMEGRLDMGKSCVRFKNPDRIPFDLVGELATKISVDDWITIYERGR